MGNAGVDCGWVSAHAQVLFDIDAYYLFWAVSLEIVVKVVEE